MNEAIEMIRNLGIPYRQVFGAMKSKSVEGRNDLPGHPIPGDKGGCLSSTSIIFRHLLKEVRLITQKLTIDFWLISNKINCSLISKLARCLFSTGKEKYKYNIRRSSWVLHSRPYCQG